jgi:cytochrome c peroxidase
MGIVDLCAACPNKIRRCRRDDDRKTRSAAAGLSLLLSVALASVSVVAAAAELDKSAFRRPAEIPFPADNPYTPEKAALGKALYFDPRLSGNENTNCGTCHNPSFGWEAPGKTAVGAQNTHLGRRGPTILNIAWVHPLF